MWTLVPFLSIYFVKVLSDPGGMYCVTINNLSDNPFPPYMVLRNIVRVMN